jgi:hypothetical protein
MLAEKQISMKNMSLPRISDCYRDGGLLFPEEKASYLIAGHFSAMHPTDPG